MTPTVSHIEIMGLGMLSAALTANDANLMALVREATPGQREQIEQALLKVYNAMVDAEREGGCTRGSR